MRGMIVITLIGLGFMISGCGDSSYTQTDRKIDFESRYGPLPEPKTPEEAKRQSELKDSIQEKFDTLNMEKQLIRKGL